MPAQTHVKVICRFRPVNQREMLEAKSKNISKRKAVTCSIEKEINTVVVALRKISEPLMFVMDEIIGMDADQEETFKVVAEPIITDILDGYNGTIFAYGQTGSGKTHSMYGPEGRFNATQSGIVPRAIGMLIESLDADNSNIIEVCYHAYIHTYGHICIHTHYSGQ